MKQRIYIDQGNSQTKFLVGDKVFSFANSTLLSAEFKHFSDNICLGECEVFYSSVNKVAFERLSASLTFNNCIDIASILQEQTLIDFTQITGMGSDRKLSLFGAMNYFEAPFATIDFGTALTVNILDSSNICLGGLITLGINTHSKALHHFTSALPLVQIKKSNFPATNTDDALSSGILISLKGTIKEILSELVSLQIFQIALTGGDSNLALSYFNQDNVQLIHDKNLNLQGMKILVEKNINKI